MKKRFIFILSIIPILVVSIFVFDWGRSNIEVQKVNNDGSIDLNIHENSTSTFELPVILNNLKDNQEISNHFIIKGKARGYWFFEASFPIQLVDTDGNILGTAIAQAEGDWMTQDFVDFTAVLEYTKSTTTKQALLVLNKDNPSGDPDKDQSIFVPVVLK